MQCPTKIHDFVDDLESLFWVLVYSSIKRFAEPDQDTHMYIFEIVCDANASLHTSASRRSSFIASNTLSDIRFTETMETLLQDFQHSWWCYHMERKGPMRVLRHMWDNIVETARVVPDPSHWRQKLASALELCDADNCATTHADAAEAGLTSAKREVERNPIKSAIQNRLSSGKRNHLTSSRYRSTEKRKPSEDHEETFGRHNPRRSKRLRRH